MYFAVESGSSSQLRSDFLTFCVMIRDNDANRLVFTNVNPIYFNTLCICYLVVELSSRLFFSFQLIPFGMKLRMQSGSLSQTKCNHLALVYISHYN